MVQFAPRSQAVALLTGWNMDLGLLHLIFVTLALRMMSCLPLSRFGLATLGSTTISLRGGVMLTRDADVRVGPRTQFPAQLKRDDPSDIGLVGGQLKVEHQLCVLIKKTRDPQWRGNLRKLLINLSFGFLDASLNVAYSFEVFTKLVTVMRSEVTSQLGDFVSHGIEQTSVLFNSSESGRWVSATNVA